MTVIGCPDLAAPVNGWMRHEGSDVIMGCNATAASWRMVCDRNRWVTHGARNCTPGHIISLSIYAASHAYAGYCYRRSSVVGLYVCLLITFVSHAKTGKPIEMPFEGG